MQDPNADTEWNDILRKKGILPSKEKLEEQRQAEEEREQQILQQQSIVMKNIKSSSWRTSCLSSRDTKKGIQYTLLENGQTVVNFLEKLKVFGLGFYPLEWAVNGHRLRYGLSVHL